MAKNYYDILGAKRDASEKEIRHAFRQLARQHHPDVNPGDKGAEARFKEINEAYSVLSDPEKRRNFDRYGSDWQHADQFAQSRGQRDPGTFQWDMGRGDFFSGMGNSRLEDLLGDHLRGGGQGRANTASRRRARVEHKIDVSLQEAFDGATRLVRVAGDGAGPDRRLEVKIPPGVDNDARIRVRPDGETQTNEFYLTIAMKPDPRFERRGDDLLANVQVPMLDAVLGGEVQVATMKESVLLKIPPDTQNGRSFRLTGKGMPKLGAPGTRGNLLVSVQIQIPSEISDRERELFLELKHIRDEKEGQDDDISGPAVG